MGRALSCPRCGAPHELVNPGIALVVCESCRATIYFGEDEALRIGRQSVLPDSDARLYLHATGTLDGESFEVVGHLRYAHESGYWDEWYLQFASGKVAWLSEDERQLSRQVAAAIDGEIPRAAALAVRAPIVIEGETFTVREIGTATLVGGEGQLPFPVTPEDMYIYAELATLDGNRLATLEYDDQRARCFIGAPLAHDSLRITSERTPRAHAPRAGKDIVCTDCGGPLEIPGRKVITLVCAYCGAQLDLSTAERTVLGKNPEGIDPTRTFSFAIGDAATFDGVRYEVCGRLLYQYRGAHTAHEYLLFAPDAGYLWLSEEDGHYVLNRPTQAAPEVDVFRQRLKHPIIIGGRPYRLYELCKGSLRYVDGALPWRAKVGDRFREATLIAPPRAFIVERDRTSKEVECFEATYVDSAEVWKAFFREGRPPAREGVHAAQPFTRSPITRAFFAIAGVLAAVNLVLFIWSYSVRGELIFQQSLSFSQAKEGVTSQPFVLPDTRVVRVQVDARMNNAWLAPQVAFVNENDQVVADTWLELGYYSGVGRDGYSWDEGSREGHKLLRAPDPGTYRLLIQANGEASRRWQPSHLRSLKVSVYADGVLVRYFASACVVPALILGLFIWRKIVFERRRWED